MTRDELVADLKRRAAEAERAGYLVPAAALLRAVIAEVEAMDGLPAHAPLISIEAAAQRLGVQPRWLYEHGTRLGFVKRLSPKMDRVDPVGLERWVTRL